MRKNKKILACLLILIMALILKAAPAYSVARPASTELPAGSLIIGVYIIPISALEKDIYDLALKSAEFGQQQKKYYKSEFGNGAWFDITNADSIDAVTSGKGKVVSNSDIDSTIKTLKFWVQASGKIIDLDSGLDVGIDKLKEAAANGSSDFHDKPEDFNELGDIKIQRSLAEKDTDSTAKYEKTQAIDSIIKKGFESKDFQNFVKKLKSLDDYTAYVKGHFQDSKDELLDILSPMKEQLMLLKEIAECTELDKRLEDQIKNIKDSYPDLASKFSEALGTFGKKIPELTNKLEVEPQELVAHEIWARKAALIANIDTAPHSQSDKVLGEISLLGALARGQNSDPKKETALLSGIKENLLSKISAKLAEVNSGDYTKALAKGEADQVLKDIRAKDLNALKDLFSQNESLNGLLNNLTDNSQQKIDLLKKDKDTLSGAFADLYKTGQNDKIQALNDQISKLAQQINGMKTQQTAAADAAKGIAEKIKALKEQYMGLIEKGELDKAKEMDLEIGKLDEEQSKSSQDAAGQISALAKEKNELANQLDNAISAGELGKISDLKNQIAAKEDKIAELSGLLPGNVKLLLGSYDSSKQELLKALDNQDIAGANQSLDEIAKVSSSIPDSLKGILKDEDTQNKAEQAVQAMLNTASANSDTEKLQQLAALQVAVKAVLEGAAMDLLEKNKEEIARQLELLGQQSSQGQSLQNIEDKIKQLEATRTQLKESLLNVLDSSKTGAAESILSQLMDVTRELSINQKEELFIKLDNLKQLKAPADGNSDMPKAVNAVKSDIFAQLKDIEKSKYTSGELTQIEAKSKAIAASGGKVLPLPIESVITRGMYIKLSDPPVKKDGNLFIAVRSVYEFFNAIVKWSNDTSRQATIVTRDKEIVLRIGNYTAYVNGVPYKIDRCPELINDRTYVSLDFIAKTLGYECTWLGDENIVTVTCK